LPSIIKNINTLTSQGNIEGRQITLNILEAGLKASGPYDNVRKLITLKGKKIVINCEDIIGSTSLISFINSSFVRPLL